MDQIINGLTIGGIYALMALGYTLVYIRRVSDGGPSEQHDFGI